MGTATSKDGTTIAFDRSGDGPPVVLISGGPSDRSANAQLAALLAARFTVLNYDRRGRGESGDTPPYSVDREFEDLAAVIDEAGGSAALVGNSGTGNIALEAAARGLPVTRLALWEPPFIVDGSRPPVPKDWGQRVEELVSAGRPGDALAYWITTVVGAPAEMVPAMRTSPFWAAMEPNAHMLVRDAALLGDFSLPAERLRAVTAPTLLLDGGQQPWLSHGVRALAAVLPNARYETLASQSHDIPVEVLVAAVADFLAA
jgi:pimeloyl-ACP methyl ester carboxylesterase